MPAWGWRDVRSVFWCCWYICAVQDNAANAQCRFKLDLGHRIAAAKKLNKDAVQRVIRGAYSHLSHKPADDAPIQTPGMKAVPALSFNSMHDHGTAGVRMACSMCIARMQM